MIRSLMGLKFGAWSIVLPVFSSLSRLFRLTTTEDSFYDLHLSTPGWLRLWTCSFRLYS